MSLGQIIRNKREFLHLTLDEVGLKIGFSKPYLSTIETGKVKNPPSDELLRKLEVLLEFEPGELLHFSHMEGLPSDIRKDYESSEAENKKLKHVINKLKEKKSDPQQYESILSEAEVNIRADESALSPGKVVPIINKVAAGYPADFNDLDYPVGIADDYVRCPDIHDPNAFAVRVIGDSMEPKFFEGDIVVFSPACQVNNGDDCFVRFSMPHETTFKRIFFEQNNSIRLQPRNEQYSPMVVEGDRINGIYRAVIKYQKL